MLGKKLRGVGGLGRITSFTYTGEERTVDTSSPITYSSAPLSSEPSAGETRTIYVLFTVLENNVPFNITGCTIGGVSATQVENIDADVGSGYSMGAAIYKLDVASGTTADIAITTDESPVVFYQMAVFAVYSTNGVTETDSNSVVSTSFSSITSQVDDVILIIFYRGTSGSPTEDNLAEDYAGSFRFVASGTSSSTSYTPSVTNAGTTYTAAYVSIGPV